MKLYSKTTLFGFFLLITGLMNTACKKQSSPPTNGNYVEGRVFDILSNQPIAGAYVELWEDDQGGETRLSSWDRRLGTATSDDSGWYRIPFEGCSDFMKQKGILARKGHYYTYPDPDLALVVCIAGRKTDYSLLPSSWLMVNIKNVNPLNEQDSIYLNLEGPLVFVGTQVDTTIFFQIESNGNRYFYWDVTKNNQPRPRDGGYVWCVTPFDTCNVQIHY